MRVLVSAPVWKLPDTPLFPAQLPVPPYARHELALEEFHLRMVLELRDTWKWSAVRNTVGSPDVLPLSPLTLTVTESESESSSFSQVIV